MFKFFIPTLKQIARDSKNTLAATAIGLGVYELGDMAYTKGSEFIASKSTEDSPPPTNGPK